jgi:hypothetical protein
MDTEMPPEATLWGSNGKIPVDSIPRTGEPDSGRASILRTCAYADRDTAEIFDVPSGREYHREKCDSDNPEVCGERKNFTGRNFWAGGYYVSTIEGHQEVYQGTGR